MRQLMRVAIIVGKMNSGGKKNLIMEYYRHIDRDKIQFDFICDADSEDIPEMEIEKLGGRIYKIAPYQHIFLNMKDMYKIFKENHYPIVHAYNSTMNIFSMVVAQKAGIPVRISESLSMAHKGEFKSVIKEILKPLSKIGATHFMSCGEDCGKWQFGNKLYDAGKVSVFRTAINTEFNDYNIKLRNETRDKFGWQDKIVVGHIGRFVPQKNPLFMIEIFAEICKQEKNAILCLIGTGELKQSILDKANELGIMDHINYLGHREDIQQFYNAMDVFLLPSLYEGLPVVGLEAQSCGLPVFFSTEVTREASACDDLGHFISLNTSAKEWATQLLQVTKKNISIRKSHAANVKAAGFDSTSEALRMQRYYFNAYKEQNNLVKSAQPLESVSNTVQISVIIPVYKTEDYIENCLQQLIKQTYKNYEIILVDDGSPDKCPEICDKYAAMYDYITVIHKENGGPSIARNCGLKSAKGKFITFVDSDDLVSVDYLEKLINLQMAIDADISIVGLKKITSYTEATISTSKKSKQMSGQDALLNMLYQKGIDTSPCAMLIRKEIVEKYPFPVGKLHEDDYTTYKYFMTAKKVVLDSNPRYFYLQRPGSIMHSNNNAYLDEIDAAQNLINVFKNKNKNLLRAAESKKFSNYCQILLYNRNLKILDFDNYKMIIKWLKSKRLQIFFDRKTRLKNKIAAIALIFGDQGLCMLSRFNN